jgi:hypothetical protein
MTAGSPLEGVTVLGEFMIPVTILGLMWTSPTVEWSFRVFVGVLFLFGTVLPALTVLIGPSPLSTQTVTALVVFPTETGAWVWQMAVLLFCAARSLWWDHSHWNQVYMRIVRGMLVGGVLFVGLGVLLSVEDVVMGSDDECPRLLAWLWVNRQDCLSSSWQTGRVLLDMLWLVLVSPSLARHVYGFPDKYRTGYVTMATLLVAVALRVVQWNDSDCLTCVMGERWSTMILAGQLVLSVHWQPPPRPPQSSVSTTSGQGWLSLTTQELDVETSDLSTIMLDAPGEDSDLRVHTG